MTRSCRSVAAVGFRGRHSFALGGGGGGGSGAGVSRRVGFESAFTSNVFLAFPVTTINAEDQVCPFEKPGGFLDEYEVIFNAIWECLLETMTKGPIPPIDLTG